MLYADDITLITSSFTVLQNVLFACEKELVYLHILINSKKSGCLRTGPRCDNYCADIVTCDGCPLSWVKELHYLEMEIHIIRSTISKWSLDYSKRSFYRAANGIFGKIGRIASEDVVIQLLKSKCTPWSTGM